MYVDMQEKLEKKDMSEKLKSYQIFAQKLVPNVWNCAMIIQRIAGHKKNYNYDKCRASFPEVERVVL